MVNNPPRTVSLMKSVIVKPSICVLEVSVVEEVGGSLRPALSGKRALASTGRVEDIMLERHVSRTPLQTSRTHWPRLLQRRSTRLPRSKDEERGRKIKDTMYMHAQRNPYPSKPILSGGGGGGG